MMEFWAGVFIAAFTSFLRAIYTIVTLDRWFASLKSFFYWLPVTFSLGFLSGNIVQLLTDDKNMSLELLVAIVSIIITGTFSYILDRKLSILATYSNAGVSGEQKLKVASTCMLGASFVASLMPILAFRPISLKVALVLLVVVLCAIYWVLYDRLQTAAESEVEESLNELLLSYVDRNAISFERSRDLKELLLLSPVQVLAFSEQVSMSVKHVFLFKPLRANRPHCGLETYFLPLHRIEDLSAKVQENLMCILTAQEAVLDLLLDKGDMEEAKERLEVQYSNLDGGMNKIPFSDFVKSVHARRERLATSKSLLGLSVYEMDNTHTAQ